MTPITVAPDIRFIIPVYEVGIVVLGIFFIIYEIITGLSRIMDEWIDQDEMDKIMDQDDISTKTTDDDSRNNHK